MSPFWSHKQSGFLFMVTLLRDQFALPLPTPGGWHLLGICTHNGVGRWAAPQLNCPHPHGSLLSPGWPQPLWSCLRHHVGIVLSLGWQLAALAGQRWGTGWVLGREGQRPGVLWVLGDGRAGRAMRKLPARQVIGWPEPGRGQSVRGSLPWHFAKSVVGVAQCLEKPTQVQGHTGSPRGLTPRPSAP